MKDFINYKKRIKKLLEEIGKKKCLLTENDLEFYKDCCYEYFILVPPIIFSDIERELELKSILAKIKKYGKTII